MAANSSGNIKAFCVNKKTEKVSFRKTCKNNEKRYSYAKSGKSAYRTWQDLGNTGSEQDFINSLRGSSGSAARSFAITCYQKLREAESAGYIWTDNLDLSRFERATGCQVASIDINPFANLSTPQPIQVTSADLVGFYGGVGSGYEPSYFFDFIEALYAVGVRNTSSLVLCGTKDTDVLKSSISGKTYILDHVFKTNLQSALTLRYGAGTPVSEDTFSEREVQVGDFYLNFSKWVTSVPTDSESSFVLDSIVHSLDRTPIDISEVEVEFSFNGNKASRLNSSATSELPHSYDFETTEALGEQVVQISVSGYPFGSHTSEESFFVGVESCQDGRGPYLENRLLTDASIPFEGHTPFQYIVNVPNIQFEGNGLPDRAGYLISEGFDRYVNKLGLTN